MSGDAEVKLADVVRENDGMNMMIMLGVIKATHICTLMIVFENESRNYPIRGITDDAVGVCYRSQPEGWMDLTFFLEWIKEKWTFNRTLDGRKRIILMENAGGDKQNDEVKDELVAMNTEVRFLLKNATDLCQPADSFVIQEAKTAWRRLWDKS